MKKYLVIGNPINHSLSPKLHNYWLKENNIDAIYDKKRLDENEHKNIISEIKEEKINGINVTVPFKKAVIPFLDELSPEAKDTQSVNTIYFQNGITIGHNTDIAGFELAIKYAKYDISNKKQDTFWTYLQHSILGKFYVLKHCRFRNTLILNFVC